MVDQKTLAASSIVLEDPSLDLAPFPPVQRQLVVFDFDWSLADQDTDRWVHEVLSPRLRIEFIERKPTMQFTDMCAQLLVELHGEGRTRAELEEALRQMPIHPAMIRGVRALQAQETPKTDFLLLSNSNEVYIHVILEHKRLLDPPLFKEVITNPAHWEDDGLLRLSRRVKAHGPQHGCAVGCSSELDTFHTRHASEGYERTIYVGDGGNDFCPILRLQPSDVALVRRHRGLAKRIVDEGGVQCEVRYWSGAWELEQLLLRLGARFAL
ncbi:pyridoxal phosphatase [Malassezia sp. CBS 17886]|nr:pyridoxal phosphatase [Malassezia sp. CBS 17886]